MGSPNVKVTGGGGSREREAFKRLTFSEAKLTKKNTDRKRKKGGGKPQVGDEMKVDKTVGQWLEKGGENRWGLNVGHHPECTKGLVMNGGGGEGQ